MAKRTEFQFADVVTEIKARITWGESPEEIREHVASHFPFANADDIERAFKECLSERSRKMRLYGIVDIAVGALIMLGFGGLARYLILGVTRQTEPIWYLCIFICLLAACAGAYPLVRGLERLICGARADGHDPDAAM